MHRIGFLQQSLDEIQLIDLARLRRSYILCRYSAGFFARGAGSGVHRHPSGVVDGRCNRASSPHCAILSVLKGRSNMPRFVSVLCLFMAAAVCPAQDNSLLRSEEHTSELQSLAYLVCRLLLGKKNISKY